MNNLQEMTSLVQYLKHHNKYLATWGAANSEYLFVESQKTIGVHAVITDE